MVNYCKRLNALGNIFNCMYMYEVYLHVIVHTVYVPYSGF